MKYSNLFGKESDTEEYEESNSFLSRSRKLYEIDKNDTQTFLTIKPGNIYIVNSDFTTPYLDITIKEGSLVTTLTNKQSVGLGLKRGGVANFILVMDEYGTNITVANLGFSNNIPELNVFVDVTDAMYSSTMKNDGRFFFDIDSIVPIFYMYSGILVNHSGNTYLMQINADGNKLSVCVGDDKLNEEPSSNKVLNIPISNIMVNWEFDVSKALKLFNKAK